jgi:hypothetical protein
MAHHTTLSRRDATLAVPRPQPNKTGAGGDARPSHLVVDSTGLPRPLLFCARPKFQQGAARELNGVAADGR